MLDNTVPISREVVYSGLDKCVKYYRYEFQSTTKGQGWVGVFFSRNRKNM